MEIKKTSLRMINFDLTRDRDVIFRRTISAIQLAIEKAKKHFEELEDYEMCHTCMSLIEQIKNNIN